MGMCMHVSMHAYKAQTNTFIVIHQALSILIFVFKMFVCRHVHMCTDAYVCTQDVARGWWQTAFLITPTRFTETESLKPKAYQFGWFS